MIMSSQKNLIEYLIRMLYFLPTAVKKWLFSLPYIMLQSPYQHTNLCKWENINIRWTFVLLNTKRIKIVKILTYCIRETLYLREILT